MSTLDSEHAETQNPQTINGPGGGERLRRQRRRRTRRRPSVAGCSSETTTDGSFRFSDTSEDEYHSWRSSMGSMNGFAGGGGSGPLEECAVHGVGSGFRGCWGEEEEEEMDLESGELEMRKVNGESKDGEVEKDCRICHLSLLGNGISDDLEGNEGIGGIGIQLGCACKGDLGNAHKQCAETWFKIKGNTTCEICGVVAINIAGEQAPDISSATAAAPPVAAALPERQNYCRGRRIMNFLLACMIFAFVISWLFHFNVLS